MQPNQSGIRRVLPGLGLLLALVILGICIYKDYGAGWDENAQRAIGATNLQYIQTGNEQLLENADVRDHGAAFELPLIWAESKQDGLQFGDAVHMRHLVSFLFYTAGVWCGYLLALRLFKKQWLALLGMGMLVLQPRIFAHAFINSKDVPFLAATLIGLYLVHLALSVRRGYLYLLAGLACGFATGIRNAGVLLVLLAAVVMLIDAFQTEQRKKRVLHTLLFGASAAVMLYTCWPAIWSDPIEGFVESFGNLSNYTEWDYTVLLNGVTYPAAETPWYYAPEWMLISTPVLWIMLGIAGFIAAAQFIIKYPRQLLQSVDSKVLLVCGGLFLFPLLGVISLSSVLYDDWRHLYFIYPAFVMIALFGADRISKWSKMRIVLPVLISVEVLLTGFFMITAHPFQNVYFNALVPHSQEYLRKHFDYEYWGTSNKQALDYLFGHIQQGSIPVVMTNYALINNAAALPAEKRARIRWMDSNAAGSYFLTTYRFHPGDYPQQKVWSIQRSGSTVMQIYRIGMLH